MNRVKLLCIVLALACASGVHGASSATEVSDQNRPLRLRRSILPVFPKTLISRGITEGWARVVIDVDTEGSPSDWLVVGRTHREFGDAAITAIREWEFDPMLVQGRAVPSQVAVAFNYEARGVVLDITAASEVSRLWFRGSRDEIYRPCTMTEIDAIPAPRSWVEPFYPRELREGGVTGSATVEFYIDESGAVRMPAIIKADFPELGHLLADAVRQWSFDPPTRNGQPVLVHARQTVVFGQEN